MLEILGLTLGYDCKPGSVSDSMSEVCQWTTLLARKRCVCVDCPDNEAQGIIRQM